MAQTGFTPILVYASGTATNVPSAANLTSSASGAELALNYADGKLYFKNSSGVVTLLASSATVAPVTTFSAGTTGFTPSSATFGAVTLAGTLATTNGGTGLTSFTANGVVYASSSSALTTGSALTFDGTILGNALTANATYSELLRLRNNGVGDGTGAKLSFNFSGTERGYVGATYSSGWITDLSGTDATRFLLSGSEQMRLTSTGLGIGTSSPWSQLTVGAGGTANPASTVSFHKNTVSEYRLKLTSSLFNSDGAWLGLGFGYSDNYMKAAIIAEAKDANARANLHFALNDAASSANASLSDSKMVLTYTGNLGLGVTPSAWLGAGYIDFPGNGYVGNAASYSGNTLSTGLNAYYGTGNWRYKQSSLAASRFDHTNGAFAWYTAPSGTAGDAISFTQAMTLDASGNLLVGGTSVYAATMTSYGSASRSAGLGLRNSAGTAAGGIFTAAAGSGGGSTDVFVEAAGYLGFNAGGTTERARITSVGNFKIGGSADRATTEGTNQLVLFNGTAPVGTLANGVSFYSTAGEARVMDAAGNATLLSPHDTETNEWIFHSKHTPTGKVLKIDVERLLKFVNDHFGLDAVHEFIEE